MGPNNNEPAKIPNGMIEKSVPDEISSSPNLVLRSVATEPSVIRPIPKRSNPVAAAQNTGFLFNMSEDCVEC